MTVTEQRLVDELRFAASALQTIAESAVGLRGDGIILATKAAARAITVAELVEEGNLQERCWKRRMDGIIQAMGATR